MCRPPCHNQSIFSLCYLHQRHLSSSPQSIYIWLPSPKTPHLLTAINLYFATFTKDTSPPHRNQFIFCYLHQRHLTSSPQSIYILLPSPKTPHLLTTINLYFATFTKDTSPPHRNQFIFCYLHQRHLTSSPQSIYILLPSPKTPHLLTAINLYFATFTKDTSPPHRNQFILFCYLHQRHLTSSPQSIYILLPSPKTPHLLTAINLYYFATFTKDTSPPHHNQFIFCYLHQRHLTSSPQSIYILLPSPKTPHLFTAINLYFATFTKDTSPPHRNQFILFCYLHQRHLTSSPQSIYILLPSPKTPHLLTAINLYYFATFTKDTSPPHRNQFIFCYLHQRHLTSSPQPIYIFFVVHSPKTPLQTFKYIIILFSIIRYISLLYIIVIYHCIIPFRL